MTERDIWRLETNWPRDEPIDFRKGRGGGNARPRFELIPFDKIQIDTAPAYLVKGIVPRVGLCIFWGPPKCGKSFLVFDLMMHVALGWKFRDRKVRQGVVVYCALEGCAAFKNRIEAFRQARLADDITGVPFHLMASPMALVADQAALIAAIRGQAPTPAAVVIDTLNRSLTGSESDDRDMAAYVKAADAIRDAFGCAVVIVHHCGHEGTRPRGHSSLMGALDAQIAVKRDAADNVIATIEVMKDGAQGDEFASKLEVIEVGVDDDGDAITSCVIAPVDGSAPRNDKSPKLTASAAKAFRALYEIIDDAGIVPPAEPYIPMATKAVTVDQWRDHAIKRGISGSADRKSQQQAFRRAFDELASGKRVGVSEPWAWPVI
jgi:AAA domain